MEWAEVYLWWRTSDLEAPVLVDGALGQAREQAGMIVCGDARRIPLPDESVQCVVTSPPYWGLRKYAGNQDLNWGDGWRGAYGLEPSVDLYVAHTVEILREVRRVLRKDGVCFWNVGDSYCSTAPGTMGDKLNKRGILAGITDACADARRKFRPPTPTGMKPKDLCLIPMRVALAAQADGWWVRSVIIWAKPNPMPESVTDRPTDAYEHILMLTKSAKYFWDAEAVKETSSTPMESTARQSFGGPKLNSSVLAQAADWGKAYRDERTPTRNLRNVWTFATQPYSGAHFATFPEELPRRCILAASSAKGACRFCGAPWERVTRKAFTAHDGDTDGLHDGGGNTSRIAKLRQAARECGGEYVNDSQTVGWRPTCECRGQHGKPVPCVCLDPFGGSGTTGRVAIELNRRAVLLDLAYGAEYAPLAEKRTSEVQVNLF